MAETGETAGGAEASRPTEATLAAWEAQAHMLAYRNSVHGSVQAEEAKHNANRAFDTLTALTHPQLFAGAMQGMRCDDHSVQDVLQNTYLKAYNGLPKFRGDSRVETWLYKIMLGEQARFERREAKHMRGRDCSTDEETGEDYRLERQLEIQDAFSEAIQDLSPRLGRAVVMFHLRGLSHEDIAEKLDILEGTSKTRVRRALQKLRESHPIQNLHERLLSQDDQQ